MKKRMRTLDEFINEDKKKSFNKKLKKMFPSLKKDYLGHGNMVDAKDYLKYDHASLGGDDNDLINNIIRDLEDGGVDKKDIEIGAMVDDTWGWDEEDLDTRMHAGTLWIDTDDDELIQKIIKKYEPDEYRKDKKIDKYRLWFD